MDIGQTLRSARITAGLGLRQAARMACTSHATLSAYEKGIKTPSVTIFLRILEACNYSVNFTLHRRIREHNGLKRGEELAQVLQLAEQFPARHEQHLPFPKFALAKNV